MNLPWSAEPQKPVPLPEHAFLGASRNILPEELRILCIDAYQPVLNTLEIVLTKAGYRVATATSVAEGLLFCSKHHVDVAIFDCSIHSGDHICLGEQLRSLQPDVKVLVWSAGHRMQKRKGCRQVNFVRPVPANELVARLEELMRT